MSEWFERPELLWIALAFLPFALWDALRRWSGRRGRQVVSVVLRVLLLAGITAGLAQPHLRNTSEVGDVIFVVDRSASIPDSLLEQSLERVEALRGELSDDERAGLVLFDSTPEVIVYPGREWSLPAYLRDEPVDETNLATALQVAVGLIPHGHSGRIVLLSDARATHGNTQNALDTATRQGIPIWTIPIEPKYADPAVTAIELRSPSINPGETLAGQLLLRGGPENATGTVRISLGDEVVLEEATTLMAGETLSIPFQHSPEKSLSPGLAAVRAEWVPDDPSTDTQLANNVLSTGVNVNEPPKVLIIASVVEEVENLRRQLDTEEMASTVVSVAEFGDGEFDFEDFELVVLGNVPALAPEDEELIPVLSEQAISDLRRYVSGGGGLIVLGGDQSYELGGYGQTELATVLPIELQPRDPEMDPAVTMIMILDNSGSMGTWAEGGTKMELANQGAAAASRLLRSTDYIGVTAVDDRVDWVVPLQRVDDRDSIERSIIGIPVGGGGIYVYTSLREAYRQMRRVDTALRHVILFSDAADSEEQVSGIIFGWGPGPNCYDIARAMHSEGITVSVIGIGTEWDQDVNFLRNLADAGGGRFYLTDRASELESLFIEETQRLVDSILNEQAFRVRREKDHPAIEGLEFRRSPRLSGLIELEARETAEVILTHPDGHPVLTTWRYGLGQVAALAIDAGPRWAEDWLDWEGYGVFWAQLSRWAIKRHEGDDTAIEVTFDSSVARLRVARRTNEGLTEVEGGVHASLVTSNDGIENEQNVALQIIEPGLWESELETQPGQRYTVRITDEAGEVFAEHAFVAPSSPEFRFESADLALLQGISAATGAGHGIDAELPTGELSKVVEHRALWLYFLCGALLLMPLDAFLRRSGREA